MCKITGIMVSEECDLYSRSHDVSVFENVFFAFWSKFVIRE